MCTRERWNKVSSQGDTFTRLFCDHSHHYSNQQVECLQPLGQHRFNGVIIGS